MIPGELKNCSECKHIKCRCPKQIGVKSMTEIQDKKCPLNHMNAKECFDKLFCPDCGLNMPDFKREIQDWEKEFDELFNKTFKGCGVGYGENQIGLKSFIKSILDKQKKELRDLIAGERGYLILKREDAKAVDILFGILALLDSKDK